MLDLVEETLLVNWSRIISIQHILIFPSPMSRSRHQVTIIGRAHALRLCYRIIFDVTLTSCQGRTTWASGVILESAVSIGISARCTAQTVSTGKVFIRGAEL